MPLKIYTDTQFLNQKHRKRVFPVLLDLFFLKTEAITQCFILVDTCLEADIAVFPIDVTYIYKKKQQKKLAEFIHEANLYKKKIWIYSGGDIGKTIEFQNVQTFRMGGFDSKLDKQTAILPCFVQDPYKLILKSEFKPIKKESKPVIGFVGHANASVKGLLHEFLVFLFLLKEMFLKNFYFDYQPFYPSGSHRAKILKKIQISNQIISNFIFRSNYTGGSQEIENIKKSTLEFYSNMNQNPYVFCLRGLGNFSLRFYEALLMGRIPVVVESDMRLPLSSVVDWKKHCVFVKEKTIVEDLIRFHTAITEEEFLDIQINNRNLSLDKLGRVSYFIELYNHNK